MSVKNDRFDPSYASVPKGDFALRASLSARDMAESDCVEPETRSLVIAAQNGSSDAHQALRARYRPLLEASVARFSGSDLSMQDQADLHEEAERVFLAAISTFDTEQDAVDFGLYAKICLRNGLVSEWRRMETRRRLPTVPLPEAYPLSGEEPSDDPARTLAEEERFRTLCRVVSGHLSEFENRVWWPYVTGTSVRCIAADLGCDERAVHNAIYRIRHKLRTRLTEPPQD